MKDSEPSASLEEAALMRRVQAEAPGAFQELYDRFSPRIMGFLFGLSGDRALSEDLTQETFLRAWQAAPRWQPRARLTTWLFQIAKRLWWKHRAREARPLPARADAARAVAAPEASRTSEAEDEARRLRRAVLALPPRSRIVFVLVRLEDLSYGEVARILGIPLGTVKSRLVFAESWLRNHLEP